MIRARADGHTALPVQKRCCDDHSVVSDCLWPHGMWPVRLFCPWNSPRKNIGVGSHSLLQGIFPIQESNPSLLHCRQILYHLSHQRSPNSSLKWSEVNSFSCVRLFSFHQRLRQLFWWFRKTVSYWITRIVISISFLFFHEGRSGPLMSMCTTLLGEGCLLSP